MANNKCRFCNNPLTYDLIDLGMSPLANSFLNSNDITKEEFFPLQVKICDKCHLVQLNEFASPKKIFEEYAYFSSFSQSWLEHVKNYADMIVTKYDLKRNSLVIEIASNDGYLLQFFKQKEIEILGIEPAINVANVAMQKGIPTLIKFFGKKTAKELVNDGKQADLLIGNNVLAHVPNLNDFVSGLKILLKPTGIITMEFPHLMQLIIHRQFDTIYHEHFSYFSLYVVQNIFAVHKLKIFNVEELPTHGGSLRIYATHYENDSVVNEKQVDVLIKKEIQFGINDVSSLQNFSIKIKNMRDNIRQFFISTKNTRKKIACYGAPAKGNTLLNYCSIGTDFVDFTVDASPYKQGLFLPGTHIPIKNIDEIEKTKPDFLVILPWNLKHEIMKQMSFIREWGGKFVILVPEIEVLE